MNDEGKAASKVVISIARSSDPPRQFALSLGEALAFGRAADCDVVLPHRGISGHHAALRYRLSKDSEPKPELCVEDTSTNGTGTSRGRGESWVPLRKGESREIETALQVLLPFNCKVQEEASVVTIIVHGDGLPDAYDERRQSGRWLYQGKLGEGALGIVHKAADVSGKLGDAVAIKVSKVAKGAKPTSKLRNAFILHREAQWSLQRLHNSSYAGYRADKADLFVRYLEDHTGKWTDSLDFDKERSLFESSDFRWDKFRPPQPMPAHPYVAMEFVPGRTLHAALGWIKDQSRPEALLTAEERFVILQQAIEALQYLTSFGLIHRDFRTTNIMVSGTGTARQVRVIDLGHTILAEQHQLRNKSAVVRCNWKEEEKKRFDWAPPEVKAKENFVNFAYPHHSFDVFSFGVLAVQLQSSSLQDSRTQVDYLSGMQEGACIESAVGLDQDFLKLMLGQPTSRPSVEKVAERLRQSKRKATEEIQRPSKRQAVEKGIANGSAALPTAEGELSESLKEPTSVVEEELRQAAEASPEDKDEKNIEVVARSAPGPEKNDTEQREPKRAKIQETSDSTSQQTQALQEGQSKPGPAQQEHSEPQHEPQPQAMQQPAVPEQPEAAEQVQEQQKIEEQPELRTEQTEPMQPLQPGAHETQLVPEQQLSLQTVQADQLQVEQSQGISEEQIAEESKLQQDLQSQMQQLQQHFFVQQQLMARTHYLNVMQQLQTGSNVPVLSQENLAVQSDTHDAEKDALICQVAWNKQSRPPQAPQDLRPPLLQLQPQISRPVFPFGGKNRLPFPPPNTVRGFPSAAALGASRSAMAFGATRPAAAFGAARPAAAFNAVRPAVAFGAARPLAATSMAFGIPRPRAAMPLGPSTLRPAVPLGISRQEQRPFQKPGNLLSANPGT
mmetsp:Transcript_74028/g.130819  ORF Transcript_74028/g.130819 Transcript_74028/m.130819 type:complete len:899 (+) Transcript_74028:86-2782(+)